MSKTTSLEANKNKIPPLSIQSYKASIRVLSPKASLLITICSLRFLYIKMVQITKAGRDKKTGEEKG